MDFLIEGFRRTKLRAALRIWFFVVFTERSGATQTRRFRSNSGLFSERVKSIRPRGRFVRSEADRNSNAMRFLTKGALVLHSSSAIISIGAVKSHREVRCTPDL